MSNQQYIRRLRVLLGTSDSEGIDVSDFRVKFSISQAITGKPKTADIRLYNVSRSTLAKIQQENALVEMYCGYGADTPLDKLGLLFKGTVFQLRYGRENGTDTFLQIIAMDGGAALANATINQTFAAGTPVSDLRGALIGTLQNVDNGALAVIDADKKLIRGVPQYGMTRNHLRQFAEDTGCSFFIENGKVVMIPSTSVLKTPAVVINRETGMIGMPQVTPQGIAVRCLLNPQIMLSGQIQLDNATIQDAQLDTAYAAAAKNFIGGSQQNVVMSNAQLAKGAQDTDGMYKVISASHVGDTRGNEWYTDIICVGVDASMPVQQVFGVPSKY